MAANRSVMAPLAVADSRRVMVEMPDGTLQPVENVPSNVKDDEVAKQFGGRVMSTAEDMVRSAGSGIVSGAFDTLTAGPKAMLGLRRMAGLYGEDEWKRSAAGIQALESAVRQPTGANYVPRTKPGEYSKSIAQSAVPIPGLGPLGLQAGLGATSGVLGQVASDANLGPAGVAAASTLPFLGAAAVSAARPRYPAQRTSRALDAMTPEQRATMDYNVRVARENNLPMMAWQAAPEGSEIRNVGRGVAAQPDAEAIRKVMNVQNMEILGDKNLVPPTQSASTRIGGPKYERIKNDPVDPTVAEATYRNVLRVIDEKQFAPDSAQADMVRGVAAQIGEMRPVPIDETLARLQKEAAQYQWGDPRKSEIQKRVVELISGKGEPEMQFVPKVRTVGQMQNVKQNPNLPASMTDPNVTTVTKLSVRQSIDDVMEPLFPKLAEANSKYRQLKDVQRAVEQTSATDRATSPGVRADAKTEVVPDLFYAGATTPMWALVPQIRRMGEAAMMRQYNKAFLASDPEELARLASKRPLTNAAQLLGGGLLQPFRQGAFVLGE